jgi:hypothetical protein
MAEDHGVRAKAAWMLEQKSRFPNQRPEDVILGCMHTAARNVLDHRVAMKPQEVAECRASLLEAAAFWGDRGRASDATAFESLANSLYKEDDPAMVAYRKCGEDDAEALAQGTLRTLVTALSTLHASPMSGIAAAFATAAAGVKPLTRHQARGCARYGTRRAQSHKS